MNPRTMQVLPPINPWPSGEMSNSDHRNGPSAKHDEDPADPPSQLSADCQIFETESSKGPLWSFSHAQYGIVTQLSTLRNKFSNRSSYHRCHARNCGLLWMPKLDDVLCILTNWSNSVVIDVVPSDPVIPAAAPVPAATSLTTSMYRSRAAVDMSLKLCRSRQHTHRPLRHSHSSPHVFFRVAPFAHIPIGKNVCCPAS